MCMSYNACTCTWLTLLYGTGTCTYMNTVHVKESIIQRIFIALKGKTLVLPMHVNSYVSGAIYSTHTL